MQDVGLHPREAELGILQVIGWLVDGWGRSTMPVVVQCCRKAAPGSVKRYSAAGQQEYRTGFEVHALSCGTVLVYTHAGESNVNAARRP